MHTNGTNTQTKQQDSNNMHAASSDRDANGPNELQVKALVTPNHSRVLPSTPPLAAAAAQSYSTPQRHAKPAILGSPAASDPPDCQICLTTITTSSSSSPTSFRSSSSSTTDTHCITLDCNHSYHCSCLANFLKLGSPLDEEHMLFSCPKCRADGVLGDNATQEAPSPAAGSSTAEPATPQPVGSQPITRIGSISPDNMQQLVHLGFLTPVQKASLNKQLATATSPPVAAGSVSYSCIQCSSPLQVQLSEDITDPRAFTVVCEICETEQCCSCGVAWTDEHVDISCIVFKARQQLAAADPDTRKLLAQSLPCPSCGHGIIKVAGCNKVRCAKCKLFMCWTCGQQLPRGKAGYAHFSQDGAGLCRKYAGKRASWMGDLLEEAQLLESTKRQQRKPKQPKQKKVMSADTQPVQKPQQLAKRASPAAAAAAKPKKTTKGEQQQLDGGVHTRKRKGKYSVQEVSDSIDEDDDEDVPNDDDADEDWHPNRSRRAVKRRR